MKYSNTGERYGGVLVRPPITIIISPTTVAVWAARGGGGIPVDEFRYCHEFVVNENSHNWLDNTLGSCTCSIPGYEGIAI